MRRQNSSSKFKEQKVELFSFTRDDERFIVYFHVNSSFIYFLIYLFQHFIYMYCS